MKIDVKDILFWILLFLSIILIIWYIVGNSPSELAIMISIISLILVKMWNISDNLIRTDLKSKHGFNKIRNDVLNINKDISFIKKNLYEIKEDIQIIKNKLI